jgi:hypothetical protein
MRLRRQKRSVVVAFGGAGREDGVPPELEVPDDPDPPVIFEPITARGRPLISSPTAMTRAATSSSAIDPPPF